MNLFPTITPDVCRRYYQIGKRTPNAVIAQIKRRIQLMNKTIPTKFYIGDNKPIVRTVGELKALLEELPDDLRVSGGWGKAAQVTVFNHGLKDAYLELMEDC